ncbi:hypothetical protein VP01_3087g1 [Puccinia sorghi]|uniref:Reverse transcriptase Ty1/copia-type domain-containing protein n=1 Tax=Puccinia sorghi TaxID=27349 RepID=A0A0L6UZM3_9BASI|nr:hypothetical protein VP01_3087g1 [Puccinia sorghi]
MSWFEEINYCPSVSDACLFIHKEKNSFIFFHVDDLIVVGQTDAFEQLFFKRNEYAHSRGLNWALSAGIDSMSYTLLRTKITRSSWLLMSITIHSLGCSIIWHVEHVLHCWKYLKGTADLGLLSKPKSEKLIDRISWFTDATWAEDHESQISRSGSLAFWRSCPILWNSKKQRNITMSSTESEMNALSDGEQENQWLTFLIEELWKTKLAPTLLHIDNKRLLEKEKFKNEEISVKLIPSSEMVADSLTKAALPSSVEKLQNKCLLILLSTTKEGC